MYLSRKVERTFILSNQQKDTKRNNNSAFQNDNECAAMTRRMEKYIHYIHMANIFTSLNIHIYRIFLLTGQVLFFATMQVFCSLGYYVPRESTNHKKQ